MRLSNAEHEAHGWRIDELAPDFRLEDAWALPAEGGPDDFPALLEVIGSIDPAHGDSAATRLLFRVRRRVGDTCGWDRDRGVIPIPGDHETSLRTRLPDDLRGTANGPKLGNFTSIYRTDDEWAAETSNQTVHAVMHLAWVDQGDGTYQGRMAVYVKPRGRFGAGYMAAIAPFRHHIVYPAMLRQIARAWDARPTPRDA